MRVVSRPSSAPFWLACGAVLSGGLTYVLLMVTGSALDDAAYSGFSLFWTAVIITSFGLLLPVEQVLARHTAHASGSQKVITGLLHNGLWRGACLAGVAFVVFCVLWLMQRGTDGSTIPVLVAFFFTVIGYATQFPARGVLAGQVALREYAGIISGETLLRAGAVIILRMAGVTSVAPYAMVVGLSSVACGLTGVYLARRVTRRRATPDPGIADVPQRIGRGELAGTVTAALCMQLLLNSAVVIASVAGAGPDAILPGLLLNVLALARLPVFVFQSAQAGYVSRIALRAHRRDHAGQRQLLVKLSALVAAAATATVAGIAAVDPHIIQMVFGAEHEVSRGAATLVALGVAAYLVASVSNDVALALGEHRRLGAAWVAGTATAAVAAALIPDLVLRCTLPLLVGSACAAVVLVPTVLHRADLGSRPCQG